MKSKNKNLSNYSKVILHLSLVLSLFVVYIILQYESEVKQVKAATHVIENDEPVEFSMDEFRKENIVKKKKIVKKEVIQPKVDLNDLIKKVDNDMDVPDIDIKTDEDPIDISEQIQNLDEGVEIEEEDNTIYSFRALEEVPVFPGCEKKKDNEGKRKCFEKKLMKFVSMKFNSDLANQLGLRSGKKKIKVMFHIDKNGEAKISRIMAPHKALEKEAERIIDKLPTMTPGKQRNQPVNVKYYLPISFYVE
ncbi:energy transducer TonB [Aureivirga sp. CE67]|uniref:energy transducer TonB n=1 Tax=Aureivirga sp. CE67 TaxID=1788983 RepID=UPI0018CB2573|nr:energy transducer TonB [Aureivirga sp. CE67]